MRRSISRSGRISRSTRRWSSLVRKSRRRQRAALRNWARMVARAAPSTPIRKTPMKRRSRQTLVTEEMMR